MHQVASAVTDLLSNFVSCTVSLQVECNKLYMQNLEDFMTVLIEGLTTDHQGLLCLA